MLDIRWIRENAEKLDNALEKRGASHSAHAILELDKQLRTTQTDIQELQSRRNTISKEIGQAKSSGEDTEHLFEEMKQVGPKVKVLEDQLRKQTERLEQKLLTIPNVIDEDTPLGKDDSDNVEIRKWGTPTSFDFEPKHHYDLGEELGGMDFETSAKIAGSRFVWMQGALAKLERALACFMLDTLTTEFGFKEVMPPLLVNDATMQGTGQLPKFADDLFRTTDDRWLIPTAEVSLTNYAQERIFKEEELPFKFCAWTPCFRKEAGSAGRDTRGYIRMHQFNKVEMVQLVHPEKSAKALDFMTNAAETILQKLNIPYRVVTLCSGDIGFGAKKTYDIEVWVPAQNTYREISSCSNCGDFQARRMNARFKTAEGKNEFLHTLNGSGLAAGRTLVAVLENYQQADGSIKIPEVIKPYMGGLEVIKPENC